MSSNIKLLFAFIGICLLLAIILLSNKPIEGANLLRRKQAQLKALSVNKNLFKYDTHGFLTKEAIKDIKNYKNACDKSAGISSNLKINKDSTIITCMRQKYLTEECMPDHKWWNNTHHQKALGHRDFDGGHYKGKSLDIFIKDIQKFKQGKYGGCGYHVIDLPNMIREKKWELVVITNKKIKKDKDKINDPKGIIMHNGNIIISNEGNGNILQINATKGESEVIGASTDIKSPQGITSDFKNYVYFTDTYSKSVYKLIIGKPIEELYKSPNQYIPQGITVGRGKDRTLYFSTKHQNGKSGQILKYTGNETPTVITEFSNDYPGCLALSNDESHIYFNANAGGVYKVVDSNGITNPIRVVESKDAKSPVGIFIDTNDNLWVTDNNKIPSILRFDLDGGLKETIRITKIPSIYLYGISVNAQGKIIVSFTSPSGDGILIGSRA